MKLVLLGGVVTDPSGARVPGASVHITSASGSLTRDLSSDGTGHFSTTLPAGAYTVVITAPGFDPFYKDLHLNSSSTTVNLDARLLIAADTTVQVNGSTNMLSTGEADNGSQLSFSGDQLEVFSDDDATFQQQLLALAGGDNSRPPQIYVDGFSGGSFPPKSAIRAIKINQNPFSAEYDQLGFGRIEISTKPGTGRLHGSVDVFGDPSGFNSRNPFLQSSIAEPGYYRLHTKANIGGPLGKKTSFFLSGDYYNQQNNAIINPTLPSGPFSLAVPDPQSTNDYTARLDSQLSTNNTATLRYEFNRIGLTNGGLGALTLPAQAYNSTVTTQTLQVGNTQVINPHAEHETKFEWIRTRTQQLDVSHARTTIVTGLFQDGQNQAGDLRDNTDHYEFLEKGSYEHGNHFIRAGFRWRLNRDANFSNSGFNGQDTYTTLADYTAHNIAQSSITTGRQSFEASTQDTALYAEDEWKARKSLTVDLGARFEWQTAIGHVFDPSPHFGIAWSLGAKGDKPARVVLRYGAAIFYDRFQVNNLLTTVRQGDPNAQTTVVTGNNPSSSGVTTYTLSPNFRAEYDIYNGGGAEFSLGKWGGFSVNLIQDRGLHQFLSRNANAPRADGTRPFGNAAGNKYEFDSAGRQWSTFFFVNPHINVTKHIALWAFWNIQRNYTDFTGPTGFVSDSYNTRADYGRSPYMRHMQLFTGGNWDAPHDFNISYFLATFAGRPFNITTPYDNNNDSLYNDRPSYTTLPVDNTTVFQTPYGRLNAKPVAGEQIIPFDLGHSPAFASLQVQAKKTWRFGPRVADDPDAKPEPPKPGEKPKLPDPRYSVTFAIEAQNLTNTKNPAPPIGVLGGPNSNFLKTLAQSNNFITTSAASRTFALHTSFNF